MYGRDDLQRRLVSAHLISRMRVYLSDVPPKRYDDEKDTAGNQKYRDICARNST
jgi:hypothetical protein